jgi:hypothetical protein
VLAGVRGVATGADGRFAIENLPAGEVTLVASATSMLPAEYGQARYGAPGAMIALTEGAFQSVDMVLTRAARIRGTVSGGPNDREGTVTLARADAPGTALRSVTLQRSQSRFTFSGLQPGDYIVSWTSRAKPSPILRSETITLAAGDDVSSVELRIAVLAAEYPVRGSD